MSKVREKVFVGVVSNLAIFLAVLAVFAVSFSGKIISVINAATGQPYYHGDQTKPEVSLMFNVYWGDEYIPEILDILDRYEAKSTFFVGGSWAMKNPELLEKICDRGHEIGNHGQLHRDHKQLTVEKNRQEIEVCHNTVFKVLGAEMKLFAPPSGSFSETTLKVASEMGYKVVMWTRDTIDWRDKDKQTVYSRATKNMKGGDLVLMHPTRHTTDALPDIFQKMKDTKFKAVTVSQNLNT